MRILATFATLMFALLLMTHGSGCKGPPTTTEEPDEFNGPGGKLGGSIKFNGNPVEFGKIIAMDESKRQATGRIMPGGIYAFRKAPSGKVKLCLQFGVPDNMKDAFKKYRDQYATMTPDQIKQMNEKKKGVEKRLPPGPWDNMSKEQQRWIESIIEIPSRYEKLETANLSTTVEEGAENRFDIELGD
jgi:hypothetical protein